MSAKAENKNSQQILETHESSHLQFFFIEINRKENFIKRAQMFVRNMKLFFTSYLLVCVPLS